MRLRHKRAVVTGSSQGLGFAIACKFALEGADVLLCARTSADLESAAAKVRVLAPESDVITVTADIAHESEVDRLVEAADTRWGAIDILVCNAGVYGPKGGAGEVDWSDWTQAIAINLVGTAYCCRQFLPLMRRAERGKILVMSGGGATKPMPNFSAYSASKAGIVRFAEVLADELADAGIDVNSIAPGALNTRLLDEVLEAGPDRVGTNFYEAARRQKEGGGAGFEKAAALCVYLASSDGDGISGKLISAVWDPWTRLSELREKLRKTDVYTLRRIVPSDRGLDWPED